MVKRNTLQESPPGIATLQKEFDYFNHSFGHLSSK